MTRVLIIDDNQSVLNFLRIFLLQSGNFEIDVLQNSEEAFEILDKEAHDVLLLDMDMPVVTGMDILEYISKKEYIITTIVLTGVEDIDLAISAMKLGTFDYMLKPINEEKLLKVLKNAANNSQMESGDREFPPTFDHLRHKHVFKDIITQNSEMLKIFHFVEKFANTDNSVLIWGESGTGKELIAKAIHEISDRRDKCFVAVNAGSFANELFASEFFGYEKGAFTGATKNKKGFLEEANGGTLFLDEIGELALPIQVKLLRVLQEEEFFRLGSTKNIKVNVRIIAATNKNLFEEINKGNFRKDLFFRLNINSISLPPLRERQEDILLLADHFLKKYNEKYKKNVKRISKPVINSLKTYAFPGNIRELMNIVNSSLIVEATSEIKKKSLPNYLLDSLQVNTEFENGNLPPSLETVEKGHIKKVLVFTGNNKTKASQILGISRVNLIAKIKKYAL